MLLKSDYSRMVVFVSVMGVLAGAVSAQECIYRDAYGEAIMHTGGAAIAAGIAMMDEHGTWGIPDNYDNWDLNADGIPDRVQFELLTDILCMSNVSSHPTVDFEEIRTTYEDNLAMYWDMVNVAMAAESAIAAGGPDIRQVGLEIRAAVVDAGIQDDPLPVEVFGGTVPDGWEGRTWQDLGDVLFVTGSDINWMVTNGWIGVPSSPLWLLLDNTATAYTMAALLGLDTEFTMGLFSQSSMQTLTDFVTLHYLDWTYILTQLLPHGLTSTTVANVENSIDTITSMGVDESMVPVSDALAITSNGVDALDGDVLWGESTFIDLYNNNGGDPDAIWDEIVTQLPALPVGGAGVLFAMAASCALGGAFLMRRKKK